MSRGSFSLAEYPTEMVRLACPRCHRRGQYRKANLLERFPADTPVPDLRHMLAQYESPSSARWRVRVAGSTDQELMD
jgi:hypothetical protein